QPEGPPRLPPPAPVRLAPPRSVAARHLLPGVRRPPDGGGGPRRPPRADDPAAGRRRGPPAHPARGPCRGAADGARRLPPPAAHGVHPLRLRPPRPLLERGDHGGRLPP